MSPVRLVFKRRAHATAAAAAIECGVRQRPAEGDNYTDWEKQNKKKKKTGFKIYCILTAAAQEIHTHKRARARYVKD